MMNLEKRGDANSSAKAAEEVGEKVLVAMLEDSAQCVKKSSVSRPVVVPEVTISKFIQSLFRIVTHHSRLSSRATRAQCGW